MFRNDFILALFQKAVLFLDNVKTNAVEGADNEWS